MTDENLILKRGLANDSRFSYLPDKDRHYTSGLKKRFKFAVIGCGIMGQEHIRVTEMEGQAMITAVYDPNPGSVTAAVETVNKIDPDRKLRIYSSLKEAASDKNIDGLIICTPNHSHLEVLKILAESGKHILLEKPMATTVDDAADILKIAESYPAVFQLGLQYRFKAHYAEAISDVLRQKLVGDVKMINISERRIPFLDKVGQWNKQSRLSGGTLVEKCCHYFDLFNLFAESRPVKVTATGDQAVNFRGFSYEGEQSDIIDNAYVIVEYENKVKACFHLCMFSPLFHEELVICGDRGMLRASEIDDFMSPDGLKISYELFRGENGQSRRSEPGYPVMIEKSGHSGATFFEHVYFIDNILGLSPPTATAAEGFWSVVVGYAAELSIKRGEAVYVEEII